MKLVSKSKKFIKRMLKRIEEKKKINSKYSFEGNPKGEKILLYILAGYKDYLWDDVFLRIKKAQLPNMDICIGSSGKYSKELSRICHENGWTYLSTKKNNVCIMSNIIINRFPNAEYIFKMDEDIYLPKDYFKQMLEAYKTIEKETDYSIGYILPYQPLGVYAMKEFLIEHDRLKEFENKFGRLMLGGTYVNPVFREDKGVDEFIWEVIGDFDKMSHEYSLKEFEYEPCILRPCIASILFSRSFWDKMGGFKAPRGIGVGDNGDEGQMTAFCALRYQVAFCVKNIMIGHFAFGGSEKSVLKLKERNPEIFSFKDEYWS